MSRPTLEEKKDQIAKLPQWAQALIGDLDRERRDAARLLNEFVDNQATGPFYFEEWVSDGQQKGPKQKRRFVATETIVAEHHGIRLRVGLREEGILVQWENVLGGMRPEVGLIPTAFQSFRLVGKVPK